MTMGWDWTRTRGHRLTGNILLLLVPTAALIGCGGDRAVVPQTTATVHLRQLESCLRRGAKRLANTRVTTQSSQLDALARKATAGAAVVLFDVTSVTPRGLNRATLVLEKSEQVAKLTLRRYRAVYKALGGNPNGLVDRRMNAVEAYQLRPSRRQRQLINNCLTRS
jgi:hypothetical protein